MLFANPNGFYNVTAKASSTILTLHKKIPITMSLALKKKDKKRLVPPKKGRGAQFKPKKRSKKKSSGFDPKKKIVR